MIYKLKRSFARTWTAVDSWGMGLRAHVEAVRSVAI